MARATSALPVRSSRPGCPPLRWPGATSGSSGVAAGATTGAGPLNRAPESGQGIGRSSQPLPPRRPRFADRAAPAFFPAPAVELTRPRLFGGLVVLLFANGISERVFVSVATNGPGGAVLETFGISLIIWAACATCVVTLLGSPPEPVGRRDLILAAVLSVMALIPIPALGSLGLALVAIYLCLAPGGPATRRAAVVLLALSLPLFWDKLLLAGFTGPVLHLDAILVASVIGTTANSNVVPLPDGSGALFLAPACSSLTNLSLAAVTAAIFANLPGRAFSRSDLLWSTACGLCILLINVARISLIGLFPAHYDQIHGPLGASIANGLMLVVLLTVGHNRIGLNASHDR